MAVICLNCGYEMSTRDEISSTLVHIGSGVLGALLRQPQQNFLGPVMNHKIGTSEGVKCPNCGYVGRWKNS